MDLQGTPLGSTSQGTKNTTDPAAYQSPKHEAPGAVASDSLAGESTRSGGAFSQNPNVELASPPENLVNTKFSGATTLAPALDAAEREAKAAWQEVKSDEHKKGPEGVKYPEGAGGQGKFPGTHTAEGYYGGSTKAKQELLSSGKGGDRIAEQRVRYFGGTSGERGPSSGTSGGSPSTGNTTTDTKTSATPGATFRKTSAQNTTAQDTSDQNTSASTAPGYITNVVSGPAIGGKPKGKDLTEGGFDPDEAPNVSFTGEIGTEEDPGRAAEGALQRRTVAAAGGWGRGRRGLQVRRGNLGFWRRRRQRNG